MRLRQKEEQVGVSVRMGEGPTTQGLHGGVLSACDDTMQWQEDILEWLLALEEVQQDPVYHPEGDALYHSLQVFGHAFEETEDRELWAAALLHDIGKAVDGPRHAQLGASWLEDDFSPRVVWLVRHHMDLLYAPIRTRRRLRGSQQLRDLEMLRRWDLAGRVPDAWVMEPEDALASLFPQPLTTGGLSAQKDERKDDE